MLIVFVDSWMVYAYVDYIYIRYGYVIYGLSLEPVHVHSTDFEICILNRQRFPLNS